MSKNIIEALEDYGEEKFKDLIRKMELYVIKRLEKRSPAYGGLEPIDFVFNVISKAFNGDRNYDPNKVEFELFLFGALKSDISAALKKVERRKVKNSPQQLEDECHIIDLPMFEQEVGYDDPGLMESDFEEQKKKLLELFGELNEIDNLVLDCWCDGIEKPKEIAELLELDIKEIYKAVKRLERKKIKLQQNG